MDIALFLKTYPKARVQIGDMSLGYLDSADKYIIYGDEYTRLMEKSFSTAWAMFIKAVEEDLLESLEFAAGAIGDAIGNEDGLDGAAGEAILKMIGKCFITRNLPVPNVPNLKAALAKEGRKGK